MSEGRDAYAGRRRTQARRARVRASAGAGSDSGPSAAVPNVERGGGNPVTEPSWDVDAPQTREPSPASRDLAASAGGGRALPDLPLSAQVLSLYSVPGVHELDLRTMRETLGLPETELKNAAEALCTSGALIPRGEGNLRTYAIEPARKVELETMFRQSAIELGESRALMVRPDDGLSYLDEEEPRLPVTAGLLSIFLPGTGQLLNGDVSRACLVFAVWSFALLSEVWPIWLFVALYAGAEAFFTAKIRGVERRVALEEAAEVEPNALGPAR